MIQRIQSVFLLLASAATFGLFGLSFAKSDQAIANSQLFSDQQFNLMDDTVLMVLFCLAGAIAFLAIFLFKNRVLQRNLTLLSIVMSLAAMGWSVFQFTQDAASKATEAVEFGFGLGLPVLAIIFAAIAARFIKRDDKLVRSMDRLR